MEMVIKNKTIIPTAFIVAAMVPRLSIQHSSCRNIVMFKLSFCILIW